MNFIVYIEFKIYKSHSTEIYPIMHFDLIISPILKLISNLNQRLRRHFKDDDRYIYYIYCAAFLN